jgi:hypothetical protein
MKDLVLSMSIANIVLTLGYERFSSKYVYS